MGVRDIRTSAELKRLLDHHLRVRQPPLTYITTPKRIQFRHQITARARTKLSAQDPITGQQQLATRGGSFSPGVRPFTSAGRRAGPAAGLAATARPTQLTEDDGDLLVRRRERVGDAELGQDDEGPVDGGAQPGDVRVPPQRAALPDDGVVVHVALPRLDRALRDVRRPVRPPRAQLPDAVPAMHAAAATISMQQIKRTCSVFIIVRSEADYYSIITIYMQLVCNEKMLRIS